MMPHDSMLRPALPATPWYMPRMPCLSTYACLSVTHTLKCGPPTCSCIKDLATFSG